MLKLSARPLFWAIQDNVVFFFLTANIVPGFCEKYRGGWSLLRPAWHCLESCYALYWIPQDLTIDERTALYFCLLFFNCGLTSKSRAYPLGLSQVLKLSARPLFWKKKRLQKSRTSIAHLPVVLTIQRTSASAKKYRSDSLYFHEFWQKSVNFEHDFDRNLSNFMKI